MSWWERCQFDWRVDGVSNMVVWTVMSYISMQSCGRTAKCRSWADAAKWGFYATVLSIGLTCMKGALTAYRV